MLYAKRITSVLFTAVLLVGLAVPAWAETDGGAYAGYSVSFDNLYPGELEEAVEDDYVSPSNIASLTLRNCELDESDFEYIRKRMRSLKRLDIGSSYGYHDSLYAGALQGLSSLQTVVLPSTIEVIEARALANCSGLARITLPDSLVEIEEGAFRNTGLTSITIPRGVEEIGDSAFAGCRNLRSVTIEGGDKIKLGKSVFASTALTTLNVPEYNQREYERDDEWKRYLNQMSGGIQYGLGASVTPANSGNVRVTPSGSSAAEGTQVTMTAYPANGYVFKRWNIIEGLGPHSQTDETIRFRMPNNRVRVQAEFEWTGGTELTGGPNATSPSRGSGSGLYKSYLLYVRTAPSAGGTVTGTPSGSVQTHEPISLRAVPEPGYRFVGWRATGVTVWDDTYEKFTFDMPENDVTVIARFEKK